MIVKNIFNTIRAVGIMDRYDLDTDKVTAGIKYLAHYGYLDINYPHNSNVGYSYGYITDKIKKFQKLAGLVEDGEIGPKTLGVMAHPRCGCKDVLEARNSPRKWANKNISYYIEKRDRDITADEWDEAISKAFSQWSDVADLKFSRANSNRANCIMSIGSGRSQDFDGPGGTLAWAQLPPSSTYNGQLLCRFDSGETWAVGPNRGVLLVNVACHEIGHLLGLGHSTVNSALMAPFYNPSITKPQRQDDETRIVSLYGRVKNDPVPVPTPDPEPEPTPDPKELVIHVEGDITKVSIPGYRVNKIG